jgi:chemotaxis family two-component system response regulator PixG
MLNKKQPTAVKFINHLVTLTPGQFSGRLEFNNLKGEKWQLYFEDSRLIWAEGGPQPWRRWRRHLSQFCPQIMPDNLRFRKGDECESWQYHILVILWKRKLITIEQAIAIINSTLIEVLFDLIQEDCQESLEIKAVAAEYGGDFQNPLTNLSLYKALEQLKPQWESWCKAGLKNYSPNLAPVLKQGEKLEKLTSQAVCQKLKAATSKKLTLRDLAVYLKQDLLKLTQALKTYAGQGIFELVEVGDRPGISPGNLAGVSRQQPENPRENLPALKTGNNLVREESRPVIACVDDCPIIGKVMEKILTKNGCEYVGISEAMRALPTLLQKKPDLIFLDLVMPIANGYEICAQLRRASQFKDTPIVILSGKDGIVDRVRAQFAGCSDFVNKPIEEAKVLGAISKHLQTPEAPTRLQQVAGELMAAAG